MENINSWLTIPSNLSSTIILKNFYSISTQIIPVSGTKGQVSRSVWGTGHRVIRQPPEITGICSAFFESHGNFFRKCWENSYESLSPLTQEKRAVFSCVIRLFINEKGILVEKKLTRDCFWDCYRVTPVSYWPIFFSVLSNNPRSLCKSYWPIFPLLFLITISEEFVTVNSTQFLTRS